MSPATAAAGLVFTLVLAAGVFLAQPGAHARVGAAFWAALGLLVTLWQVLAATAAVPGATPAAFALVGWYLLSAAAAVQGLRQRRQAHRLRLRGAREHADTAGPDGVTW